MKYYFTSIYDFFFLPKNVMTRNITTCTRNTLLVDPSPNPDITKIGLIVLIKSSSDNHTADNYRII